MMELCAKFKKILSYHAYHNSIIKWGSLSSFLSYKNLKLQLRVFLAGHIVAMVTYCATKLAATFSAMIGQIFYTISLASTNILWL